MIAGPSIQAAASVTATFDATPVTAILSTAPVTAILGATQMAALLGATPLVAVVRAVAVVVEAVVAVVGVVGGVGAVVAGGVLVVLRVRFVAVTVRGRSMEPTLWHGDRVLVRRSPLDGVRPGQLVVVAAEPGASWLVKRVVAVPGDPVPRAVVPALANRPERVVPPGQLVVLGDNRPISFDSRRFGYVPARQLLGVVVGHLPKTPRRRPAGR
ncbi:S26 family signal peptidase [Nonomuraea sp. NPDC049646]|uniref:S26 family signal peptidase n=1 Tax=unclassified Nonomuraea TaxID=2593643 RepID=UPI0037B919EC